MNSTRMPAATRRLDRGERRIRRCWASRAWRTFWRNSWAGRRGRIAVDVSFPCVGAARSIVCHPERDCND
jgi:hypothetical protein